MLYTRRLITVWIAMFACTVSAQQIQLPPIYGGEPAGAAFSTDINNITQPFQLNAVAPTAFVLQSITPRFIKPGCIPHDSFAFVKFEAQRQDDGAVKLAFETENEYTSRTLTIERVFAAGTENADITQPADSCFALFAQANRVAAFLPADSEYARNKGYHKTRYEVTDLNSFTGISFYRVTETDNEDTAKMFTQIIAVIGKPIKETFTITPNPVVSQATAQVVSKYGGPGMLQLINLQGTVVKQLQVYVNTGLNSIQLPAGLAGGMYYARLLRQKHPVLQATMVKL
jgi:hypothetical protein